MASIFDYFFVLRPTLFFPIWTVFLAGYFVHAHQSNPDSGGFFALRTEFFTIQPGALIACGFLTLLLGAAFILNQITDIETDRKNSKLFLIACGHIAVKPALVEAGLLVGVSLLYAFGESVPTGIFYVVIFGVTGIFYSVQPFSGKDRPFSGLFVNAFAGLAVFILGWLAHEQSASFRAAIHAIPYVFAISGVYLCTTLPDEKGDRETGKMTIGVKYGTKITTGFALVANLGSIVSAFYLGDWLIFFPAIISLPFFILAVFTRRMGDILRAIKFPIFFLALAVCWLFPFYFICILFIFMSSRWYYRARFNLNYPSFSG